MAYIYYQEDVFLRNMMRKVKAVYYPIAQHLQQFCQEGQFVIWRDYFRWKRHYWNGIICEWENAVLSNHYDSFEIEQLAEEFGYEISWEFNLKHVAIVSLKQL